MIPQKFTKEEVEEIKLCPNPECERNITTILNNEETIVTTKCNSCKIPHEIRVYNFGANSRNMYYSAIR